MSDASLVSDPPHSVADEEYVLAACYVWPADYLRPCRAIITPDCWYLPQHAAIWRVLCQLQDNAEPIDHTSIVRVLSADPWVPEKLDLLAANCIHGDGAEGHARIVKKLAAKRLFLKSTEELVAAARNGEVNGEWEKAKTAKEALESEDVYSPPVPVQTALDLILSPVKPILYALKPVVALGKLTQIQGEPKAGKSVFAFYMAMCMALGYWIAGRFSIENGAKRRVLYLADEDAENLIQLRLRLFFKGLSVGNQVDLMNLMVLTQETCAEFDFDLTEEHGRSGLVNLIRYTNAEVIVLDSLSNFCPVAEENSKKEMQPIMKFLKRTAIKLGVAIIYIHHTAKPSSGVQRTRVSKGRGSGTIAAAWDIMLDWGDRGDSDTTPVSLTSKLANAGGVFDVIWTPDAKGDDATEIKWSIQDSLPTENSRENMQKTIKALKELFKTCPEGVKSQDIAAACAMSEDTVTPYLIAAMKLDKATRTRSTARGRPWLYTPLED